jgi:hypothetical protein
MAIRDLLLTEFDEEMKKTRTMLERVPADKKDFTRDVSESRRPSSRSTWSVSAAE